MKVICNLNPKICYVFLIKFSAINLLHSLVNGSRPSTPDSFSEEKSTYMDPGAHVNAVESINGQDINQSNDLQEAISALAVAVVQIAYGLDSRILKKPLGCADIKKTSASKHRTNIIDVWEESLLASTSFSQVFLHYVTLDSCVMWSRSALLARCRICRRQQDSENMLLCDGCYFGYHMYCLKPKLKVCDFLN